MIPLFCVINNTEAELEDIRMSFQENQHLLLSVMAKTDESIKTIYSGSRFKQELLLVLLCGFCCMATNNDSIHISRQRSPKNISSGKVLTE